MSSLAFAIFSWPQTIQPLFSIYNRFVCIIGGFGAVISGALLIKEILAIRKALAF